MALPELSIPSQQPESRLVPDVPLDSETQLVTPHQLVGILDLVTEQSFNLPVIEARMKRFLSLNHPHLITGRLNDWMGMMIEAHLDLALYRAGTRIPGVSYRPIEDVTQTERFLFAPASVGSNVLIYRKEPQFAAHETRLIKHAEVDGIALIEGKPVVFESKVGHLLGTADSRFLKAERINRLARPLRELYQTNEIGYSVLAVAKTVPVSLVDHLVNLGGNFRTFTQSFQEFEEQGREMYGRIVGEKQYLYPLR